MFPCACCMQALKNFAIFCWCAHKVPCFLDLAFAKRVNLRHRQGQRSCEPWHPIVAWRKTLTGPPRAEGPEAPPRCARSKGDEPPSCGPQNIELYWWRCNPRDRCHAEGNTEERVCRHPPSLARIHASLYWWSYVARFGFLVGRDGVTSDGEQRKKGRR